MSKQQIIGLTGPNASGKGEVTQYFTNKGFDFHSLSDIVREEASSKGLDHRREYLIKIGNELREKHGAGILAKRIKEKLTDSNSIIDSIRNIEEIKELKQLPGFTLIGITSPAKIRFKRELERNRTGCAETLEQFTALEDKENSNNNLSQQLNTCLSLADITINNDGTIEDLYKKIENSLNSTRPSWDEYFMKMALLAAERSTCLRHHVGTVIVKDKRILATGYNGAAAGLKDCMELGCLRNAQNIPSGERHEICRAIHAEQNAIIQAGLHGTSIKDAIMYCTHSPCILCAKMIINAKISSYITCGYYKDQSFMPLFEEAVLEYKTIKRPSTSISIKE